MIRPHDPHQCSPSGLCERCLIDKERAKEADRLISENMSSSVAAIHICNGLFGFLRSRFFKKEALAPINISIKGLERSGTGFIYNLLEKNLLSSFIEQDQKHHFPETSALPLNRVVLCVKNPYSWYLGFSDFGRSGGTSGRDVQNAREYGFPSDCIRLWNDFYNAWLNSEQDFFLLRYEDVIEHELSCIKDISRHFGIRNTENYFEVKEYINNYVGRPTDCSGKFDRKEYFLSKDYIKNISDECIISIHDTLDSNLLKKLGYSKEP